MADNPYGVVLEALAAQTVAIGRLAKEIRVEFAQYQAAQEADDTARAQAIADAINQRTAKLEEAADKLAASVPGAEVGGGPAEPPPVVGGGPAEPPPVVGGGPIEPPFTPGEPVDRPGGQPDRPVAPDQPPGLPNRPDQGPIERPITPGEPVDRPTPAPPVIDYLAPSSGKVNEDLVGIQVVGSLFYDGATVFLNGEPATKTTYVSENEVRFNDHIGTAGVVKVRVDDSNEVDFTVS